MIKTVSRINFDYIFSPDRRGSKYSLDGKSFFNSGGFHEIANKAVKGYKLEKPSNSHYDIESDIMETRTSIKSSKASLTKKYLGDDYETVVKNYFKTTHSTNWDWVEVKNGNVTIYNMNATEFKEFMDNFTYFDKKRKVIRFNDQSMKMSRYLDSKCK